MELINIEIMKNIKNYRVEEITSSEAKEINGGIWGRVVSGVASLVFWHWDNWDDIKAGFNEAQQ